VGNVLGLKAAATKGFPWGLVGACTRQRSQLSTRGLVALGDLEPSTLGSYMDATAVTRSANTRDTLEAIEDSFGSERSGLEPQVWIVRATTWRLLSKGM